MKTAVSIPDVLYAEAEETAKTLDIPRSQLFSRALEEYIQNHRESVITERLNSVYDKLLQKDKDISDAGIIAVRELTKNDTW